MDDSTQRKIIRDSQLESTYAFLENVKTDRDFRSDVSTIIERQEHQKLGISRDYSMKPHTKEFIYTQEGVVCLKLFDHQFINGKMTYKKQYHLMYPPSYYRTCSGYKVGKIDSQVFVRITMDSQQKIKNSKGKYAHKSVQKVITQFISQYRTYFDPLTVALQYRKPTNKLSQDVINAQAIVEIFLYLVALEGGYPPETYAFSCDDNIIVYLLSFECLQSFVCFMNRMKYKDEPKSFYLFTQGEMKTCRLNFYPSGFSQYTSTYGQMAKIEKLMAHLVDSGKAKGFDDLVRDAVLIKKKCVVSRTKLATLLERSEKERITEDVIGGDEHDVLGNLHLNHKWIDDSVDGVVDTQREIIGLYEFDADNIMLNIATQYVSEYAKCVSGENSYYVSSPTSKDFFASSNRHTTFNKKLNDKFGIRMTTIDIYQKDSLGSAVTHQHTIHSTFFDLEQEAVSFFLSQEAISHRVTQHLGKVLTKYAAFKNISCFKDHVEALLQLAAKTVWSEKESTIMVPVYLVSKQESMSCEDRMNNIQPYFDPIEFIGLFVKNKNIPYRRMVDERLHIAFGILRKFLSCTEAQLIQLKGFDRILMEEKHVNMLARFTKTVLWDKDAKKPNIRKIAENMALHIQNKSSFESRGLDLACQTFRQTVQILQDANKKTELTTEISEQIKRLVKNMLTNWEFSYEQRQQFIKINACVKSFTVYEERAIFSSVIEKTKERLERMLDDVLKEFGENVKNTKNKSVYKCKKYQLELPRESHDEESKDMDADESEDEL